MTYPLILFDLDGTLGRPPEETATFLRDGERYHILPGRAERLAELHQDGILTAIVTNQGGVGFTDKDGAPLRTELEVDAAVRDVAGRLGIKRVYICYYHPKATILRYAMDTSNRKPGPGMLQEAMEDAGISPQETLMVGDRPEDKQAAEAAGVAFLWADEYFA